MKIISKFRNIIYELFTYQQKHTCLFKTLQFRTLTYSSTLSYSENYSGEEGEDLEWGRRIYLEQRRNKEDHVHFQFSSMLQSFVYYIKKKTFFCFLLLQRPISSLFCLIRSWLIGFNVLSITCVCLLSLTN